MLKTLTHVICNDSLYIHGCMELTITHGIDKDSLYRLYLNLDLNFEQPEYFFALLFILFVTIYHIIKRISKPKIN